jgi:hypothetical protein
MNPDNVVEHPSCGRVLKALACVVWTCGRMFLEGMANPQFPGRIDQPADRHPHQQRQDACRLVAIPRGGQKLWVVQAAQPAFRPGLACIAGSQLRRGPQGGIACMRSEEDTTLVVEQGLTGGDPHGERAFERIDDLVRWSTWAWAPPLGIVWGGRTGLWATKVAGTLWAQIARACCASAAQAQGGRPRVLTVLTSCARCVSRCVSTVRGA